MVPSDCVVQGLIDHLTSNYSERAVEVGVGRRPETAEALASRGFRVVCTDVEPRDTPEDVEFQVDDVRDPDMDLYREAEVVYSIRPPYEVHGALAELAATVGADLVVVPLGNEETPLDHDLKNVDGTTVYVVENE